jgi:hypothetical protein
VLCVGWLGWLKIVIPPNWRDWVVMARCEHPFWSRLSYREYRSPDERSVIRGRRPPAFAVQDGLPGAPRRSNPGFRFAASGLRFLQHQATTL